MIPRWLQGKIETDKEQLQIRELRLGDYVRTKWHTHTSAENMPYPFCPTCGAEKAWGIIDGDYSCPDCTEVPSEEGITTLAPAGEQAKVWQPQGCAGQARVICPTTLQRQKQQAHTPWEEWWAEGALCTLNRSTYIAWEREKGHLVTHIYEANRGTRWQLQGNRLCSEGKEEVERHTLATFTKHQPTPYGWSRVEAIYSYEPPPGAMIATLGTQERNSGGTRNTLCPAGGRALDVCPYMHGKGWAGWKRTTFDAGRTEGG